MLAQLYARSTGCEIAHGTLTSMVESCWSGKRKDRAGQSFQRGLD